MGTYNTYYGDNEPGTRIASVDESEAYEVDRTEIWLAPDGTLILATATGCSCWDGDWTTESFATLDALTASIAVTGDERKYNPSPRGAADLIAEAATYLRLDALARFAAIR